ncbi:MAG: hypothetical protein HYV39_00875 [Candidatus Levybacteria bacterium]|nr:hypothetical protein [Candidatus Levybacteria bacterium]
MKKKVIIAGPCAAESESQINFSAREAKKRNIDFLRVSLWKPRTKPGFDGLGEKGISLLVKVAKMGVNPATEVIIPSHAEKVIEAVLTAAPTVKVLLWIGARNQNHYIQQEIARVVGNEKRVLLMVKNQPWPSLEHWEGIIEHVLHGGINPKNLLVCHRGFSPNGHPNPYGYRNVPDYEMARIIKQKFDLSMLFDPSHTGGSIKNILRLAKESSKHSFDGMVIEVHPNPKIAKTDAKQQLTWKQFDDLLKVI